MEMLFLLYGWKYAAKDNGDGGGTHNVEKSLHLDKVEL